MNRGVLLNLKIWNYLSGLVWFDFIPNDKHLLLRSAFTGNPNRPATPKNPLPLKSAGTTTTTRCAISPSKHSGNFTQLF
jgi:hypothetical protein